MKIYETVSEAVINLNQAGYSFNFNLENDCVACAPEKIYLKASELEIDEVQRFERETDRADEAIVSAISAFNGGIKVVLVNSYGIHANSTSADLVAKLSVR